MQSAAVDRTHRVTRLSDTRRMLMIRLTGTALVLATALLLAACGGGDDDDAGSDAGTTAATPPVAAPAAPGAGGSSASSGGGANLGFFASAECRNTTLAMAQAMSSFAAPTGSTAGEDPFAELAASLDAASDAAPDNIKSDLATIAAGFAAFATAIEDAGGWNPASGQPPPPAVMQALERFDTPEFNAAGDNVGAWFEDNCAS